MENELLNSSKLFLRTLGVLLKHRDGIVINIEDDLKEQFPFKTAIVFNMNGNIQVTEEGSGQFLEGQRLYID